MFPPSEHRLCIRVQARLAEMPTKDAIARLLFLELSLLVTLNSVAPHGLPG